MAAGDYAAAETALAASLEYIPDHPVLRHMLDAVRGQTSDRPPEAYVRALFDDFAETYDESMRKKLQYSAPERLAELITPMLEGRTPLRIVDLGCGTGFVGDALAHLGAEIIGVDLSEKMLAKAAERGKYAKLIKGDVVVELQRMPARTIQAIVATDLLIYVGDLQSLFAAAKHALAQDGLLAVSVEALQQGTFQLRPSGRYAHSRAYLRSLAQQNGLSERAFQTFDLRFERDRYIEGGLACFAI
jgi:predicted TPR repeat methyltransferase